MADDVKPTLGFARMDKWNPSMKEACIYYGCPTPDSDQFVTGIVTPFISEADARESVRRWNLVESQLQEAAKKKEKK